MESTILMRPRGRTAVKRRIPNDLAILVMYGTRDPVGETTTMVRALIDRYRNNGSKRSVIFLR
jgi:hypothetical protein